MLITIVPILFMIVGALLYALAANPNACCSGPALSQWPWPTLDAASRSGLDRLR